MSQSNTRVGDLPFVAGEDLTGLEGRLVKVSSDGGNSVVLLPTGAGDFALYVLLEGGAQGEFVSARPLESGRNVRVVLKGACNPGDSLVLADPSVADDKGKVRALPGDAGTYRGLLIAEVAGVEDQKVLARPAMLGELVVSPGLRAPDFDPSSPRFFLESMGF